ncbi:MAG: hypothetical protein ACYTAN_12685 [Planctomycetota bacterium]|jgi:hypothetical protein
MTFTAESDTMDDRCKSMICDLLEAVDSTDRLTGWEIGLLDRFNRDHRMQNRALSCEQRNCLDKLWRKVFP